MYIRRGRNFRCPEKQIWTLRKTELKKANSLFTRCQHVFQAKWGWSQLLVLNGNRITQVAHLGTTGPSFAWSGCEVNMRLRVRRAKELHAAKNSWHKVDGAIPFCFCRALSVIVLPLSRNSPLQYYIISPSSSETRHVGHAMLVANRIVAIKVR